MYQEEIDMPTQSSPMIRVAGSVWEAWQRIRAAERQLRAGDATRDHTDSEIGEVAGMSVEYVGRVRDRVRRSPGS